MVNITVPRVASLHPTNAKTARPVKIIEEPIKATPVVTWPLQANAMPVGTNATAQAARDANTAHRDTITDHSTA